MTISLLYRTHTELVMCSVNCHQPYQVKNQNTETKILFSVNIKLFPTALPAFVGICLFIIGKLWALLTDELLWFL